MGVKLTKSQMATLKSMIEISERLSGQLLHIMRNSGLDKIQGCRLSIEVNPNFAFTTENICFGISDSEAGKVSLGKGVYDEQFRTFGENSAEYELLFTDEATRKILQEQLRKAKPLPPDGLWVSAYDDPPAMDCGVQVSDGLAQ